MIHMEKKLDHEFCSNLRAEIKSYGLVPVVSEILTSNSDKAKLKKEYVARECKKNAFAGKMVEACNAVVARDSRMRMPVFTLKQELGLPTM